MHRDLKPANIVLNRRDRRLKLVDFGLAKRFCREIPDSQSSPLARRHTLCIGTPLYMAPEVAYADAANVGAPAGGGAAEYTEKADVFSAAIILWYLVTGRRPTQRRTMDERPAAGLARRRWPELAELLERMWAGAPADRPSAGECAEEVRGFAVRAPACGCTPQ